jgi:hypothetical protein
MIVRHPIRYWLACLALFAMSVLGAAASAQDTFSSSGSVKTPVLKGGAAIDCYQGWAACNTWRHYERASAGYQARAEPCLDPLKAALDVESQMVAVNQQQRKTSGSAKKPLDDQFRQLNAERGDLLEAYRKCVTGGGTRPPQTAGCSPLTSQMRNQLSAAGAALQSAGRSTLAAGNSFVGGMVDEVKGTVDGFVSGAEFLAQPPGEPARQIRDAVLDYLTDGSNQRAVNQALYEGAVKAVDEAKRDPARAAGRLAVNMVPIPSCRIGSAAHALEVAKDVGRLEKAAAELKTVADAGEKYFGPKKPSGSQLALDKIRRANPTGKNMPPVNPWGGTRNCYLCVKKSIASKVDPAGGPHIAAPVAGVSPAQISADLKATYGHLPPPAKLPPDFWTQWREGIPFRVTGPDDLAAKAKSLGDGSHGYVFLDRWNPATQAMEGHAIELEVRNGGVHVSDPQSGLADVSLYLQDPFLTDTYFYPVP